MLPKSTHEVTVDHILRMEDEVRVRRGESHASELQREAARHSYGTWPQLSLERRRGELYEALAH